MKVQILQIIFFKVILRTILAMFPQVWHHIVFYSKLQNVYEHVYLASPSVNCQNGRRSNFDMVKWTLMYTVIIIHQTSPISKEVWWMVIIGILTEILAEGKKMEIAQGGSCSLGWTHKSSTKLLTTFIYAISLDLFQPAVHTCIRPSQPNEVNEVTSYSGGKVSKGREWCWWWWWWKWWWLWIWQWWLWWWYE
jgi:hypothetical protein